MSSTVLWLDNDPVHLQPFIRALADLSLAVSVVSTLLEAEEHLRAHPPSLLILDVMIPTKSEAEEKRYPPEETDLGYKTGLIFFKRHCKFLVENKIKVLVMTVRLDEDILEEFLEAGLPVGSFVTKFKVRDVGSFKSVISRLMA